LGKRYIDITGTNVGSSGTKNQSSSSGNNILVATFGVFGIQGQFRIVLQPRFSVCRFLRLLA